MAKTLKTIVLASMVAISLNCDCSCRDTYRQVRNLGTHTGSIKPDQSITYAMVNKEASGLSEIMAGYNNSE
ncbi:MAG: hypothetical protein V1734_02070 [Nanoarchaeota archaeon]